MAEKAGWIQRIEQRYAYDYDISAIPEEAKQSNWSLTAIWLAWPAQLATIIAGGVIGLGLGLTQGLIAILIGNGILACISIPIGLAARRVGVGTGLMCRFSFGHRGSWGPSLVGGLVMMGWLMWMMFIGGTAGKLLFTFYLGPGWVVGGFVIGLIIAGAFGIIPNLFGYAGPKWVAYGTVVFMLGVLIAAISMGIQSGGGWGVIDREHITVMPMSMAFAIGLTIGSWINGTIKSGDFTRYCKRASGIFAGPFLGLWLCNSLVMFAGCVAANISEIARSEALLGQIIVPAMGVGGAFFAITIAMYWLTTMNTQPPTAYASALDFANVFWRRKTFLVIPVVIIAMALGAMIEYVAGAASTMAVWLPFVTHVMPTYGGIILAEIWLVNRGRLPAMGDLLEKAKAFMVNPIAYISWVAAALINWWTTAQMADPASGFSYGIPGLNGLVAALLIYWGLMSLTRQRWIYWKRWIPG